MDKIKVAINWKYKGKVSRDKMGDFNGQFQNVLITEREFINAVHAGHAYTTWHDGYRKSELFICGMTPALDFDTEDERSTFDYLWKDSFIRENALFLHTTPSHAPLKPRCRVVFRLEEATYDKERYALILAALVDKYPYADSACKDISRFFYGAVDCDISRVGEILTDNVIEEELIKPYLAKRKNAPKERGEIVLDVPDAILQQKAQSLLLHILNAPDGTKADTLNRIAYTFGGYLAGGHFDEEEVKMWLRETIFSRSIKSKRVALATIENGISAGKEQPCHFRRDEYGIFSSDPLDEPIHQRVGNGERALDNGLKEIFTFNP